MSTSEPATGLSCPICGNLIQFTLYTLIQSQEVQCPTCGLALSIDAEGSKAALSALRKFTEELDSIEEERGAATS